MAVETFTCEGSTIVLDVSASLDPHSSLHLMCAKFFNFALQDPFPVASTKPLHFLIDIQDILNSFHLDPSSTLKSKSYYEDANRAYEEFGRPISLMATVVTFASLFQRRDQSDDLRDFFPNIRATITELFVYAEFVLFFSGHRHILFPPPVVRRVPPVRIEPEFGKRLAAALIPFIRDSRAQISREQSRLAHLTTISYGRYAHKSPAESPEAAERWNRSVLFTATFNRNSPTLLPTIGILVKSNIHISGRDDLPAGLVAVGANKTVKLFGMYVHMEFDHLREGLRIHDFKVDPVVTFSRPTSWNPSTSPGLKARALQVMIDENRSSLRNWRFFEFFDPVKRRERLVGYQISAGEEINFDFLMHGLTLAKKLFATATMLNHIKTIVSKGAIPFDIKLINMAFSDSRGIQLFDYEDPLTTYTLFKREGSHPGFSEIWRYSCAAMEQSKLNFNLGIALSERNYKAIIFNFLFEIIWTVYFMYNPELLREPSNLACMQWDTNWPTRSAFESRFKSRAFFKLLMRYTFDQNTNQTIPQIVLEFLQGVRLELINLHKNKLRVPVVFRSTEVVWRETLQENLSSSQLAEVDHVFSNAWIEDFIRLLEGALARRTRLPDSTPIVSLDPI